MDKRTVLFVDDEINVLSSLKRGLIEEDYNCVFAESARGALDIMEKEEISVIVTDMRMPGMDGLSLLRIVKEKYPNTVRVVLSGYTQLQQILLAINQGDIYKFITKPWKIEDEFKPVIRQAVEYHELIVGKEEFKKALEAKNTSIQNILKVMDEKLSVSKKDYESVKKFIAAILEFIMRDIMKSKIANDSKEARFEIVQRFCLGYLSTIPSDNIEFEIEKLLDEITSNASKPGNFEEIVLDTKNVEKTICYGNSAISLFIMTFIIKYVASLNSKNQLQISINSNKDFKFLNTVIIAEVKAAADNGDIMSKAVKDDLVFIERLVNEAMKDLGARIFIQNQRSGILIKYQTVFMLKNQ